MTAHNIARLPDRAVVRVAGEDAGKFLQGLITNDIDLLARQPAIHTALLSPQGKMLFEFFVIAAANGFLIETGAAHAAPLVKRLGLYKLRAKVEVSEAADLGVLALWGAAPPTAPPPAGAIVFADPRWAPLGARMIAEQQAAADLLAADPTAATAADWHRHRIATGVPEADLDYRLGDSFLHEANLDQLNGVSFSKGCFVGQEVASRMQHRGTARKRVVMVESRQPLPSNAAITAGATEIGRIGSVSGSHGLALVRLDRAAEAQTQGRQLTAAGIAISILKPAWAQFDMAEAT